MRTPHEMRAAHAAVKAILDNPPRRIPKYRLDALTQQYFVLSWVLGLPSPFNPPMEPSP